MKLLVFSLFILDIETYQEYRKQILPVMKRHNVEVLHEYSINAVLNSQEADQQVNRLAVFSFPDDESKDIFFNDPEYQAAKPLLLESTKNVTVIHK